MAGRAVWWFGDGSTTIDVVAPSHTFAQAGTYEVTLEVRDANQSPATITQKVTVGVVRADEPPVASFTVSCTNRPHTKQCRFDASASSDDVAIVSYAWDWGNGRHETRRSPLAQNNWPKPGTYVGTLTVTDTSGQTGSATQAVVVP